MDENKTSVIGQDFTLNSLAKFVAAPVITRLLVSLLSTLDDSLFVSRFLGQNALAAFSIAFPWFMLVDSIGMMASAVSVVCSIKMGEKKNEEAKSDFTTMVLVAFILGIIMTLILALFLNPILLFLGETELLMPYAKNFFRVSKFYIPLMLMNYIFNSFYVIAGKPKWSMISSMVNICFQFFFDWFFIVRLQTGIVGAAYANLLGSSAVTLIGLFFYSHSKYDIHFVKPHKKIFTLVKNVFKYGKMQAITSLALSLGSFISNHVNLMIGGENVVAAYTIVNNVTFMFLNSFFGLIGSTSPILSYAYGEKNVNKLVKTFKQTIVLISLLVIFIISVILLGKNFIISLYLTETSLDIVKQMVNTGLSIYPMALLFFGYNVYVQDSLNVLGNHKASMFLSIMENVVFQNLFSLTIPFMFGVKAIWFVFLLCEIFTFMISGYIVYRNADVYGYGKQGIATFLNK